MRKQQFAHARQDYRWLSARASKETCFVSLFDLSCASIGACSGESDVARLVALDNLVIRDVSVC